jgi:Lhr-like helicase
MPLHPISVVRHVLDEYRSYLETEFRTRDEALRHSLEEALERQGFLAQEPFFQAHRPFRDGKPWKDLGLDVRLAKVMETRSDSKTAYSHQSQAILHLLGPDASSMVVTTGTGSGKTECFLLPVIQNAIADAAAFNNHAGLTAILVYPMNALANDQEIRIQEYLKDSGNEHLSIKKYDRQTNQADRAAMRRNPPHILLTNYMMLEYLLVRPADRDALFQNHRCRFVVLDEVHTYRGALGANIALLLRRLGAHLKHAGQDWKSDNREDVRRFPKLLPIATSATIKSIDDEVKDEEERKRQRDQAVRQFFGALSGTAEAEIKVVGEELSDLKIPDSVQWASKPVALTLSNHQDQEEVRKAICELAGVTPTTTLEQVVPKAAILWHLNRILARKPMSTTGLVERILEEIPERKNMDPQEVQAEVELALAVGSALPEGMPGLLRLRTHRFVRGGWRFHRCVDAECGRLYSLGQEECACGKKTAPLLICRSCGADALHFKGPTDPSSGQLIPYSVSGEGEEWVLYREKAEDEEDFTDLENLMRGRKSVAGSFDSSTLAFSKKEKEYPENVALAPARLRCLVCGSTAGARDVMTPVALGTSAAVRVLSEGLVERLAFENKAGPYDKQRLLIFADSRQDAAHQARFITYAGRYDRMRRRAIRILKENKQESDSISLEKLISQLVVLGVVNHDNEHAKKYDDEKYLNQTVRDRARAWEEAPFLDDLTITGGYRATIFNLGLAGVEYEKLDILTESPAGKALAGLLGILPKELAYICRCLLDEMRRHGALSRKMLMFHPAGVACPDEFQGPADWERRFKSPLGYSCDVDMDTDSDILRVLYTEKASVEEGVQILNAWRKEKQGGRSPGLEKKVKHLLKRLGGKQPENSDMARLLHFLQEKANLIHSVELHGFRKSKKAFQVNAESVSVRIAGEAERFKCSTCNIRMLFASEGLPCPSCRGSLIPWPESEMDSNRYVQRIKKGSLIPLYAGEHTAQVPGSKRLILEEEFKASGKVSPVNILACSPTLEMGIDVGGLDAVVMRNIPPRPDNYAQRGGRAGRRARIGIVLGYARNTPHDSYFYDKPTEMIAGEVPAPGLGLGNRDVVLRHLHALVFSAADPGLAGRMADYVSLQGELNTEKTEELKASVQKAFPAAVELALEAWAGEILDRAELNTSEKLNAELEKLPGKIDHVFDSTRMQIIRLEDSIKRWTEIGKGKWQAISAMNLKKRLLGIRDEDDKDADDRTAGNPLRRFAEFGVLPGYEFPSEPCSVRLRGDAQEEETITVERRFGLAQYQPDAKAHARGHRWRVAGLDTSSPWNPKSPEPGWVYARCAGCSLRYESQSHPKCPRCNSFKTNGEGFPGYEFGGFLAVREDTPVLEEEERFALAARVQCHPQWNGNVESRFLLPTGWQMFLAQREDIRWVNEFREAKQSEVDAGAPILNDIGRGFYLCPHCGKQLEWPDKKDSKKGRKKVGDGAKDVFNHASECPNAGKPPIPMALTSRTQGTTLRVEVMLPFDFNEEAYESWGYTIGSALRIGMRHYFMLDGSEVEFILEPMWKVEEKGKSFAKGALLFLDDAVGGSGFLERAVRDFHHIAQRTIEHLDHRDCESACYRCLKSYQNQRVHNKLNWPSIMADLNQLASAHASQIDLKVSEISGVQDWLDAYDEGVGSPLELKFLRAFEKLGLEVEKQVAVSAQENGAVISIADFRVLNTKILVYIDGAAFHRGDRYRRDKFIRRKLMDGDLRWSVIELRSIDLRNLNALAVKLKG